MDLTAFAGANIATFFLVFSRVAGLFAFAPVFASRIVPMRIRVILALAVSLVAMPHAATRAVPLDPYLIAPLMLKELLVGTVLAFGVAGVYAAVQLAGSLIDTTIGFSLANVVDPSLNFQSTIISQLYALIATMVFLGSGAHLLMIGGVVHSFDLIPVDTVPPLQSLASVATRQLAPLFVTAIEISSPIVATLFVTDMGFGLLARLVPQLQPMAIQFSVKILLGLGAIVLSLPITIRLIGERLTEALAAGGFLTG